MASQLDFSETNIVNTLSVFLAQKLMNVGYLIYWRQRDAVQTPEGWYYEWSTNYSTYMADATFAARVNSGNGLVVLTDSLPTEPVFIKRHIQVAGPIKQNEVPVPAISVEVGPPVAITNWELGSGLKMRGRHLIVDGYVRDRSEQAKFKDWFAMWFDNDTYFTIQNHDDGSLVAVGQLDTNDTVVDFAVEVAGQEQVTYQVLCNSRLEYIV